MIEPYQLESSNLNLMLGNMMEKAFFFLIIVFRMQNIFAIILTIWIFVSLTIWVFGAKIKSEKTIKLGVKSFIMSIGIQIGVLAIPVLVVFLK